MSTDDTPTTDATSGNQFTAADVPVNPDADADIWTTDGSHITGTPANATLTTDPDSQTGVLTITLKPATWHGQPVKHVVLTGHYNKDSKEATWSAQVFPEDGGEPVTLEVDTFDPDTDAINEVTTDE